MMNQRVPCQPDCISTICPRSNVPASIITPIRLSPSASSYEIICADDRRPPIRLYLLFEDQPASAMPYTPTEVTPSTYSNPTSNRATTNWTGSVTNGIFTAGPNG